MPTDKIITTSRAKQAKQQRTVDGLARVLDGLQKSDSWKNTSTGIGNGLYDKHYNMEAVLNARPSDSELEALYLENDLASKIVDRKIDEGLRQGYSLSFDGADNQQEDDIVRWGESRYKIKDTVSQAAKWSALFGGSGIFYGIDDGQELAEPLQDTFSEVKFLRVHPRTELETQIWYNEDADIETNMFGLPAVFKTSIPTGGGGIFLNDIHESRFHIVQGILTTRRRFIENNGWGDSVLGRVRDVLKRFDGSWISIMNLLADASVGVYKIKELMSLLESDQIDALIARFQLIDAQKNNMRSIMLDADGEEYERIRAELTDVASVMQNGMIRVAAAAGQPVSILFGQAPAGLNASPEGDLRNFYDAVDEVRKDDLGPAILEIYKKILMQKDSPTRGKVPENLSVTFPSLWQADPIQAASLYQQIATGDGIYLSNQVYSPEEVAVHRSATSQVFGFPKINVEWRQKAVELLDPSQLLRSGENHGVLAGNAIGGGTGTGKPVQGLTVSENPQTAGLNGAQVKALQDLAKSVVQGEIPKQTAIAIVEASLPITPEMIEKIFGEVEEIIEEVDHVGRANQGLVTEETVLEKQGMDDESENENPFEKNEEEDVEEEAEEEEEEDDDK